MIGRVSRLARELEQRLEPVYREHGLEPGWYDVLATLRRAGPPYRVRPTEFTSALMLTSSGTTKRLDRLEQAGLITRTPDPGDRRGTLITLTAAGLKLVDTAIKAHLANERRLLGRLTDAEQRGSRTSCASSSSGCRRAEPRHAGSRPSSASRCALTRSTQSSESASAWTDIRGGPSARSRGAGTPRYSSTRRTTGSLASASSS